MRVSNFFRYFFSILSILAALLGMLYFAMYYHSKDFYNEWKSWDTLVMCVSVGSIFVTEIANAVFVVTKSNVKPMPQKLHIKNAAKTSIPLLLIAALCAFILGGDLFYTEMAFVLIDIIFLIGGDMIDYTEVVEVETTLYEGDDLV